MSLSTVFLALVTLCMGLSIFPVKYRVMELEGACSAKEKAIVQAREAIQVLKAELAYLNDPKRLEYLVTKYLRLKPSEPGQWVLLDDLKEKDGLSTTEGGSAIETGEGANTKKSEAYDRGTLDSLLKSLLHTDLASQG
jgi:hypothetical protein